MKIIIFIENNLKGGLDTFCSTLIQNWPKKNDTFIVICNESHPGSQLLKNRLNVDDKIILHKIPLSWNLSQSIFFWLPYPIRRWTQPFLRLFLVFFQFASLKVIFKKIEGDALLVINGGYPAGETCRLANIAWYSVKKGISKKRNIHNFHNFSVSPRFGFGWYENIIDKKLLNSVSGLISVSNICSQSIKNRPVFSNYNKVKTIYNGVTDRTTKKDKNIPNLRKLLGIDSGTICIMLANYETRKGHKFLFSAFDKVVNKLPDAHLICCGDGNINQKEKINLIRLSLSNKDNIHLLDFFSKGRELISQADIVVISSQSLESFGLTAVEGMLEKIPVIATNVGGLKEVLGEPAIGGYLVDPRDVEDFSKKIIYLLSNKRLREMIGNDGKKRAKLMFLADQMAQKYYDALFKKL